MSRIPEQQKQRISDIALRRLEQEIQTLEGLYDLDVNFEVADIIQISKQARFLANAKNEQWRLIRTICQDIAGHNNPSGKNTFESHQKFEDVIREIREGFDRRGQKTQRVPKGGVKIVDET